MNAPLKYGLALHGGAGKYKDKPQHDQIAHLRETCAHGQAMLKKGAAALDVCEELAARLEDAGLYVAGRGTGPNSTGEYELDAAIMDGPSRKIGSVCALKGFQNPVHVARAVLEHTPHVMLAGRGAENFASIRGCTRIENPLEYYLVQGVSRLPEELDTGTIGVVARDQNGHLAAATSTGGLLGKMQGRVGDSPLPGAGCWADERVAVSCTGQGEYFIKSVTAADLSARLRYTAQNLGEAATAAIADMETQGGYGGLIAIGTSGIPVFPFNSEGMRRAWIDEHGEVQVAV
ncbi:MAG: isoaspartyl peptidase/L-asparaginase [Acidimicrobiales bacterium]|nr:isoaspartyl peptidase/L-asparaginase [Hyphomonadaceae bacterium]RZV44046.1 MAG: isoaspartyl peptidase/L-asparaginase [Acidimicrobiales bacterium]